MQKVRAKIHLRSIRSNAESFRKLSGTKLCAVVKANAYGHGAEEVVNALNGIADSFAVALIEEGIGIRVAAAGKEILVFTPPQTEEECLAIAENKFTATIPNLFTAKLIQRVCRERKIPVRVHIKTNTGMNRYGVDRASLGKICKLLKNDRYVQVVGVYSHLYGDRASAEKQRTLFLQMQRIVKGYFPSVISHLSATSGCLYGKEFAFDQVRVGIGLYGYLPSGLSEEERKTGEKLRLKKGMSVYARSLGERTVRFGGLGYGSTLTEEEITKNRRIYLLRTGYADGFLRKKENGVDGFENNANNLCMDVCLRTGRAARGKEIPVMLDAEKTANATGTIPYEVLCAATRRAEFVYDDD